jgi:hypothetical protein
MWMRSVLFCLIAFAICQVSEANVISGRPVSADGSERWPAAKFGPALSGPWDTLWSFACPGTFPTGLAWDGGHFWHTDANAGMLYRLSPTGVVETTFGLPSGASGHGDLTWDGTHLWMVDEQSARAYQVDTATGNALRHISLPDSGSTDPTSWGITWDGQHLWHSAYSSPAQIYELDTINGAIISQFIPPAGLILGIAWDGAYLWGVDIGTMAAYKMSVPGGAVVDSFAWQVSYPLGLEWDGRYLWNVSGSGAGTARVYKLGDPTAVFEGRTTAAPRPALLSRPEPNPFVHLTRLTCSATSVPVAGVEVFDIQGRLVRHLTPDSRNVLTWDGTDDTGHRAGPGVHFIRFKLSDGTAEQRPVLFLR